MAVNPSIDFTIAWMDAMSKVYAKDPAAVAALNAVPFDPNSDFETNTISIAENVLSTHAAGGDNSMEMYIRDNLVGTQTLFDTDYILSMIVLTNGGVSTEDQVAIAIAPVKYFSNADKTWKYYNMLSNAVLTTMDPATIEAYLNNVHAIQTKDKEERGLL